MSLTANQYSLPFEINSPYAGIIKRHNVCQRHVANDTGVKQTVRTIFFTLFKWN